MTGASRLTPQKPQPLPMRTGVNSSPPGVHRSSVCQSTHQPLSFIIESCQGKCVPATPNKFRNIHELLDRVDIILPSTKSNGRDAMPHQPVGVQTTIGRTKCRPESLFFRSLEGMADHGRGGLQLK